MSCNFFLTFDLISLSTNCFHFEKKVNDPNAFLVAESVTLFPHLLQQEATRTKHVVPYEINVSSSLRAFQLLALFAVLWGFSTSVFSVCALVFEFLSSHFVPLRVLLRAIWGLDPYPGFRW